MTFGTGVAALSVWSGQGGHQVPLVRRGHLVSGENREGLWL
jgi:hypothetical protein